MHAWHHQSGQELMAGKLLGPRSESANVILLNGQRKQSSKCIWRAHNFQTSSENFLYVAGSD